MQYSFGAYHFDPQRYALTHAGTPVPLRPQACELLAYLLRHRDRVVPKEELLAQVWPGQYVGDGVLHACVLAVRTALHDTGRTPALLHTVRGRGYRFVAPVEVSDRPLDAPPHGRQPLRSEPAPLADVPLPLPAGSATPAAAGVAAEPHAAGEYKQVSVLCCGLAEAPALAARLGPEGLYHRMQTVVGLAQEVLHLYAGTLLPLTSAGVMAVFGAPVAQEDHARRAVLTALALQQRLHQAPVLRAPLAGTDLAVRMGVHSGLVVLGELGQDAQRRATVVGAPVQVAQQMQEQAAPGMLLLSAATYHLVHAEVRVAPYGTLTVEGGPMPLYTVQGLVGHYAGVAGRGPRGRSPFVGRTRELALLHDRWEAVRAGEGQVVSLVGPPGMGKTRLLTEFRGRLAPDQVPWYRGHCLAYGQAIPYLPVRDLLRQLCALVEGDYAAAQTATVQRRLHACGISAAEEVALVDQLLDLPVAPELLVQLSPETRRARTFALLGHLIRQEAQQRPLVLAVEDVHWIDPTSEAWLGSLVERLAGTAVLLLVTARPGYQPPWGTHARVTQLALPPLRAEESQAIVVTVPGTIQLPAARCQQIVAHGAGNPFFVEELAWHAVEDDQAATPVPATVHAVLAARLDRLPPEAKRLVQHAAVIGAEVPGRLLQRVAGLAEDTLHRGLAHLQDTEVLSETAALP
jgi:DNA-binding winged helix-turn-helix (wHTH) protein/class 3 adenylate cyclase